MMLNEFLKEHRKVEEFNEDKARRAPRFLAEPSCWGLSFYASVIMALLGASERRARLALHEVQVVVPVIQRGFQALLVCPLRIPGGCVPVGDIATDSAAVIKALIVMNPLLPGK